MCFYSSKRVGVLMKIVTFEPKFNGGAEGTRTPAILLAKQHNQ